MKKGQAASRKKEKEAIKGPAPKRRSRPFRMTLLGNASARTEGQLSVITPRKTPRQGTKEKRDKPEESLKVSFQIKGRGYPRRQRKESSPQRGKKSMKILAAFVLMGVSGSQTGTAHKQGDFSIQKTRSPRQWARGHLARNRKGKSRYKEKRASLRPPHHTGRKEGCDIQGPEGRTRNSSSNEISAQDELKKGIKRKAGGGGSHSFTSWLALHSEKKLTQRG